MAQAKATYTRRDWSLKPRHEKYNRIERKQTLVDEIMTFYASFSNSKRYYIVVGCLKRHGKRKLRDCWGTHDEHVISHLTQGIWRCGTYEQNLILLWDTGADLGNHINVTLYIGPKCSSQIFQIHSKLAIWVDDNSSKFTLGHRRQICINIIVGFVQSKRVFIHTFMLKY